MRAPTNLHCAHVAAYYFHRTVFDFFGPEIWAEADGRLIKTGKDAVENVAFYFRQKKEMFARGVRELTRAGGYAKGGAA